ncbi:glycosyltransferase [Kineococcus sp. SYSU DK004]|uniref:glycosyltransferase n=1 Tax=Kineococcus sp. SYSU DK004 TaxID=3383125 RepID=UPI003D7EBD5A
MTPRLRCTVVQPFATVGGAELWLLRVLAATDRLDVDVVLLEAGPLEDELRAAGVRTSVLPTGRTAAAVAGSAVRLGRLLHRSHPDVVMANGVKAAAALVPVARALGVPVVWMKHDFSLDAHVARPLGLLADRVVANSAAVAEATGRTDAVVVPVPRPRSAAAPAERAREVWQERGVPFDRGPVVAVLGRLNPFKGMDTAVRALAHAPAREWRLVLAGTEDLAIGAGERDRLLAIAHDLGVQDRVHLVGEVPDAAHWLAAFDAVAVVTRKDTRTRLGAPAGYGREGYSLVALEALAAGVPLVGARDNPEVERMASAGGVVVEADDPADVARALGELSSPARRRALGDAGLALVREHPDDPLIADRVVQVLAEAAGRPGAGLSGVPVTVVTALRDEEGHVDALVGSVLPQLRPDDEHLLVDDRSTDGTRAEAQAWAARDPRVRVLDGPGVNAAAARNTAFRQARHEVVATVDAGCSPVAGWLDALRAPFAEPGPPDVVVGVYSVPARSGLSAAMALSAFPDVAESRRRTPWRRVHGRIFGRSFSSTRLDTRSMAVKRSAWEAVGGFDELARTAEDAVFGHALLGAGYRSTLALDAEVSWEQADRFRSTVRMYFRYGTGGAEAGNWPLVARDLARVVALVTTAAVLVAGRTRSRAVVLAGAGAYLSSPVARALRGCHGAGALLLLPVAIVVKDGAKAAGCLVGLTRLLRRRAGAGGRRR